MHQYLVRFMKRVLGENGHEVEICQRRLEVEADSEREAVAIATAQFCQTEGVMKWSDHADCVQTTKADFVS